MVMWGGAGPTKPEVDVEELISSYCGIEYDPDPYATGGRYTGSVLTKLEGHITPDNHKHICIYGTWYPVNGVVIDPVMFEPVLDCLPWRVGFDKLDAGLKKMWSLRDD